MMVLKDLRCTACDQLFDDVYVDSNKPSPCPECGGERVTSWHTGQCPGVECSLVFKPLKVGNVTLHSKAQRDAWLKGVNKRMRRHGKGEVGLESDSPAKRKQDYDEIRHDTETRRKAAGISVQQTTEMTTEHKARKREAANAH